MKKLRKIAMLLFAVICLCFVTACGSVEETKTGNSSSANTKEVANDYYIDLTDLGMKLTIYLRLDETGNFLFSNTLAFETNKSSGTFQKSGEEYIMVYDSLNGEEKSVSDGLTSSFVVTEDGSLDFSGCEKIYYGSAGADSKSEENPDAKLMAHIITEDFTEPDAKTEFQIGTYTTDSVTQNGITYSHMISFYEDNTYLHFMHYEKDRTLMFVSETGTYGVSTTQLALTQEGVEHGDRIESEVVSGSELKLSLLPYAGATERVEMQFKKTDIVEKIADFGGTGNVTGSDATFEVIVTLYTDGTYETIANGFTEKGILVMQSEEEYVKQYPNHPNSGISGLKQVETVPSGIISYENGALELKELRVRTSEELTRYKCDVK